MKDTLLYIHTHIVDHPEVKKLLNKRIMRESSIFLRYKVKIWARSLETRKNNTGSSRFVKLMAAKEHMYVDVVLKEDVV